MEATYSLLLDSWKCKGVMLVNFLMEIHDACHIAGLEVVTTVSEMLCNNAKILKYMSVSQELPFFRFHDQEIAAMYRPANLRKCTRNLALKQDVAIKHDVATVQCEINVNDVLLVLLGTKTN